MNKEKQERIVLFKDAIGRTLIGEMITERCNDKDFVVKNPVVIHFHPDPQRNGQIQVSFFPEVFPNFLAIKDESTTWTYSRGLVSISDPVVLSLDVYGQYEAMFTPAQAASPAPTDGSKIINLFDKQ